MVIFQRKMTWKRLSRANDNKFTDENIDYCQVLFEIFRQEWCRMTGLQ